jgi:hypothetical protein
MTHGVFGTRASSEIVSGPCRSTPVDLSIVSEGD